jgi:hypothetical protein
MKLNKLLDIYSISRLLMGTIPDFSGVIEYTVSNTSRRIPDAVIIHNTQGLQRGIKA